MKILRVVLAVSLAGCTLQWGSPLKEQALCDTELQYCIEPPEVFIARGWTDNWIGLSGAETAHTVSNGLAPDDPHYVRLDFYHSFPSPHCKEIGVSNPEITEKGQEIQVVQGKVDFPSDYELTKLQPDCRVYKPYTASYILCSEKDDVQVAICISQVTDDPTLAHSILATFRWTE